MNLFDYDELLNSALPEAGDDDNKKGPPTTDDRSMMMMQKISSGSVCVGDGLLGLHFEERYM